MDIYGAQMHISNLLAYVKDVAKRQPRLYEKSKDRYRELAHTCYEVIHVISTILQDESLLDDSGEFGTTDVAIMKIVESMYDELNQLQSFVSVNKPVCDSTLDLTPDDIKYIVKTYDATFRTVSQVHTSYKIVNQCSKLLADWFHTRFITGYSVGGKFMYNITMLKDWVRDIVILCAAPTSDHFITSMYDYIDSVAESPGAVRYAIPYAVHKCCSNPDVSSITLAASVLWDILWDCGFNTFENTKFSDLFPQEDSVYAKCGKINPEVLNEYVNYKIDPNILQLCGIDGGELR